jgi:hypothetical protein
MTRSLFAAMLLLGFEASAQERANGPDNRAGSSAQERASAPPPGYFITPSGALVFPDAPPPSGDTSTLSGPGPNVSTGPEVGLGPEVGSGPVVGTDQ